jgi:hypothetical protein
MQCNDDDENDDDEIPLILDQDADFCSASSLK